MLHTGFECDKDQGKLGLQFVISTRLNTFFTPTSEMILPLVAVWEPSVPFDHRMESSCLSGGGTISGEQQEGVRARNLAAETE